MLLAGETALVDYEVTPQPTDLSMGSERNHVLRLRRLADPARSHPGGRRYPRVPPVHDFLSGARDDRYSRKDLNDLEDEPRHAPRVLPIAGPLTFGARAHLKDRVLLPLRRAVSRALSARSRRVKAGRSQQDAECRVGGFECTRPATL